MKNTVVCKNCSAENPFYQLICSSCKSYLRERVYNIDLWKITGQLIENPFSAFRTIIFSEHKNFLILLLMLIAAKIFLNGIYLTIFSKEWNANLEGYAVSYIIILIFLFLMLIIFSQLIEKIIAAKGIKTKFKDNFSILTYSFIPYCFGFTVLFPIELVLFGEYLFSYNPSPFLIKETLAYVLFSLEILIILWVVFLTYTALFVQTKNKIFSLISSFSIHIVFYTSLYFLSKWIFYDRFS
jgi:hypothetical protein